MKEYKQKMAALKDQQSESRETTAEEDLWRRLDELELQEELQHELDLYDYPRERSSVYYVYKLNKL